MCFTAEGRSLKERRRRWRCCWWRRRRGRAGWRGWSRGCRGSCTWRRWSSRCGNVYYQVEMEYIGHITLYIHTIPSTEGEGKSSRLVEINKPRQAGKICITLKKTPFDPYWEIRLGLMIWVSWLIFTSWICLISGERKWSWASERAINDNSKSTAGQCAPVRCVFLQGKESELELLREQQGSSANQTPMQSPVKKISLWSAVFT